MREAGSAGLRAGPPELPQQQPVRRGGEEEAGGAGLHSRGDRELLIRDNGTGIPRKLHDKVFSPFFTTKPAGVGTGLGLAICHDIVVRQHRGEIRLDSVELSQRLVLLPGMRYRQGFLPDDSA